ncbi:MAG: hypothetical protein LAT68_07800 [Cyclobacteriaceae bacterium]|nr:hypothetical protein [Cyclobacteriaceae bacterium]MCH8516216.1 hypothetical protein [Cyclobacteriaceae bacterium]
MNTKDRWKLYFFLAILITVNTIAIIYIYPTVAMSINGVHTAGKIKATHHARQEGIKPISGRPSMPTQGYSYNVYEIHFKALDSKVYKVYDDGGVFKNKWKQGDTVPLIYEITKPHEAKIDTANNIWLPILFVLIILIFINSGIVAEIRIVWKKYQVQ